MSMTDRDDGDGWGYSRPPNPTGDTLIHGDEDKAPSKIVGAEWDGADPSVGIMSGAWQCTAEDGTEFQVLEDGEVTDDDGRVIGRIE